MHILEEKGLFMEIYVVQPGDTVDSIASTYNISVDSLLYSNQIPYPYRLAVGQALLLSMEENYEERKSVFV